MNGGWSSWGSLSSCKATCPSSVRGTRSKSRSCTNPSPKNGGRSCSGSSTSGSYSCTKYCSGKNSFKNDKILSQWTKLKSTSVTCSNKNFKGTGTIMATLYGEKLEDGTVCHKIICQTFTNSFWLVFRHEFLTIVRHFVSVWGAPNW